MSLVVEPLEAARHAAWDAFVAAHPSGTFFHRSGWGEVLRAAFGHRPQPLIARRGTEVAGVLPLVHVRSALFGASLISSPFGVYGGPLATDDGAYAALAEAADAVMARAGVPTMEWRLRDPLPAAALPGAWGEKDELYATFRKPISAGDEANMKAIPRKQRAMVRKGIERGLSAESGQDVDTLFSIYAESVRNLGTPVFPRRYFRLLRERFASDMDIVVVRDGTEPVAAVLNFYDRDEVLPYYGGGTSRARAVAGYDFMYWEVMRRAVARGCRGFDFGRSKVGTGAYAFKKNWGFAPTPLRHRYRLAAGATIPDHNPLNPKYRLMIAAWKRLPLPVANLVGPYVVRGVG